MKQTTVPTEGDRSFAHLVATACDQDINDDASSQLRELMKACAAEANNINGKVKGTLDLKLSFSVEPSGVVSIAYELKTKAPKPRTRNGLMWLSAGGNLTPKDPRQQELPLHEVRGAEKTVHDIHSTGTAAE